MAMVVKNNMSAVRTLNTLNKNSAALQKSLAKVSSGMKINSAQDDASGYAISERMRVQIRSLDQANQNTQNASSLMKTAEGAVSSTVEILKTLKEKAINAATDTNTDSDRATIQKELDQFIDQIDDNALTTFNGKYLVDGSKSHKGVAVATAMTNQSLAEDTKGTTPLTELKNRNNESLEISSTDYVTASYVMDGYTYTFTDRVGSKSIDDVLGELNKVTATGTASAGEAEKSADDLYKEVEAAVAAAKEAAGKDATYTGNVKGAFDEYVDAYTTKDSADNDKINADDYATYKAKTTGTIYSTLGTSGAGSKAEVDALVASTDVKAALDKVDEAVTAYNAKVDADAAAAAAKKTADELYTDLTTAKDNLSAALTTAGMVPGDKTNVDKLLDDSIAKDADNKNNVTPVSEDDIIAKLTNTSSSLGSTNFDSNVKNPLKDGGTSALGKAYKAYADAAAAYNTKATEEADKAAAGDDAAEAEDTPPAPGAGGGIKGSAVSSTDNSIGTSTAKDPVSTADGTNGVTVTAATRGIKGQISGLSFSITDSEGNVKKSANAALDAFKTTIYAKNTSGANEMSFQVGANANQSISVSLDDMRSEALGLKGYDGSKVSVATQDKANAAVAVFDNAIQKVLDQQATIGAIESRLEYTSQNLTTSSENVQAAESTIRDADMAKEMTTYTKNNVLLQAAQSMLAQANQNSSAVLSLLQ